MQKPIYIYLLSYDRTKGERIGSIIGLLSSSMVSNIDIFKNVDK